MSIITMATTKGGAGKTTVAQMILGSVHQLGYSIGVVDTDENQTLSNWLNTTSSMAIDCKVVLEEAKVADQAQELSRKHDLVIIDTPGAQSQATVFAIGCPPHFRTEKALAVVAPRCFGFDVDFVPLEDLPEPGA